MSSKLWEYFFRDDVESFQRLLVNANYTFGGQPIAGGTANVKTGSPGTVISSTPIPSAKGKKWIGTSPGTPALDRGATPRSGSSLSRVELNARDQFGRTLLHLIASSQKPTAVGFATALLEVPFLDIYAQDFESGWTALHRALYAGNASIAQALMIRDLRGATELNKFGVPTHQSGGLIKTKDREGYSPFDVYEATIASRDIKQSAIENPADHTDSDSVSSAFSTGDHDEDQYTINGVLKPDSNMWGDEVFTFGSNKNLNLGLGDQDDRQYPERVNLKRPNRLVRRFFCRYQARQDGDETKLGDSHNLEDVPSLIRNRPIKFQNVFMSKLHTAILTNDPESNLYLCGFGPGGRLGTGDESTRFGFVCIETGGLANKKIATVALGQDHTLAITHQGEIFSWGSNKCGQLGYNLPRSNNTNDIPIQTTPRQIFNPFKKEAILGAAASAIHSVVFTSSGLYTFGKNEGQLGLVDSDARSLEFQVTPRRVGASLFSSPIHMVSAIDHATAVLLHNSEVWVFSQYGYSKLSFPLDVGSRFIKDSFMATRYDTAVNRIVMITSGGNTICALSSFGEVFTLQVSRPESTPGLTSTTNPVKIRNSLSSPTRAWSVKKSHMAVKDVDVGQDGSIVICTVSGSAWRKEKRVKSKDASEDFKFARIPGLSRVVAVRSNAFGAFAAAQRECDITKEQIHIDPSTLWDDILLLSPFMTLTDSGRNGMEGQKPDLVDLSPAMKMKQAILSFSDIESEFQSIQTDLPTGAVWIASTLSDTRIPVHEFLLTGRSPVLRKVFHEFRQAHQYSMPDTLDIEYRHDGQHQIKFHGIDFLSILNLVFFLYTDNVLDVWHQTRSSPANASRYRQVRIEVMRIATHLGLPTLERAARLMIEPAKSLKTDMGRAITDPSFFANGDVTVHLDGESIKVHSQVVCQRCPFFDALFHGRSAGRWLSSRLEDTKETVDIDLKHIDRTIFDFVVQYMYADTEETLFDEVRSNDLDEFIDLVIDVAFVANELMIDQLARICQKMLGKFVNARNVCYLLNSISSCSVTEFKDAALEYICLNLEDMISNRLLQDLDDDLLPELDAVCRENQLAYLPISRGRNTEDYLFEKYPELVMLIEDDKRRKIDSIKIRSRLNMVEPRSMGCEKTPISPSPKLKAAPAGIPSSPILQSKQSTSDLMFQMDDDVPLSPAGALKGKIPIRGLTPKNTSTSRADPDFPALRSSAIDPSSFRDRSSLDSRIEPARDELSPSESRLRKASGALSPPDALSPSPWGSTATPRSKKDLKEIMAETSETRHPSRPSLASGARENSGNFTSKLSQKERKKLQQQQEQEMLAVQQKDKETPQNPWKAPAPSKPAKLESPALDDGVESARSTQKPSMTLRQTVAGTPPPPRPKPGPTPTQTRHVSNSQTPTKTGTPGPPTKVTSPSSNTASRHHQHQPQQQPQPQPSIQSIRHIPRPELHPSSPTSQTQSQSQSKSLASILLQQQTEKNEIREAATAKHNLHDIQQEQEFQEWWDKESKRVQGIAEPEAEEGEGGGPGRGKAARGGRGGKGPSSSGGGRKKRGHGPAQAQAQGKDDVSALTQQLSGSAQQKSRRESGSIRGGHGHVGSPTVASGDTARRGGGGGRILTANSNANANANASRGKGRDQRGRRT